MSELLDNDESAAGGGPENLLLVVNPRSTDSLTLANHYIEQRKIPPSHVVYIAVDPAHLTMDINNFRTQVLQQLFQSLQSRGILEQIDFVLYSAGFLHPLICVQIFLLVSTWGQFLRLAPSPV